MKVKKELNVQIGDRIRCARETGISIETLRTICEKLYITSDSILFADRHENDVSDLTAKFRRMSRIQFRALEQIVNALLFAGTGVGGDQ